MLFTSQEVHIEKSVLEVLVVFETEGAVFLNTAGKYVPVTSFFIF